MGDGGSDTDSTRAKESLTVSVGRTLRDQPVQEWQRDLRSQANAERGAVAARVRPEKSVPGWISNVCCGFGMRNGGMCARVYFPDLVSTSSLWSS